MEILLDALATYAAVGLLVAAPFALKVAGRMDPAAQCGTWGFRLLILPGCAALWPLLLRKWLRLRREEQRAAMRARRRR
jgi:hypothetical protein